MENMDRAPYLLDNGRFGYRMGDAKSTTACSRWSRRRLLRQALRLAYGRSRHADGHHARSAGPLRRAFAATFCRSASEGLVCGGDRWRGGEGGQESVVSMPMNNRGLTPRSLRCQLRPAFRPDGTITAGNAPGLNSGAAAMLVAVARSPSARGSRHRCGWSHTALRRSNRACSVLGRSRRAQALDRAGWKLGDLSASR